MGMGVQYNDEVKPPKLRRTTPKTFYTQPQLRREKMIDGSRVAQSTHTEGRLTPLIPATNDAAKKPFKELMYPSEALLTLYFE